jgi:UDP-N-acetylmuramate: L-alanyl-gamma-D-glutamyl-meso-diaminopimelate ligase
MGGVAALARAAGHDVSGCDRNVYPPMSTQLKKLGIEIHEGVDGDQLDINPDCVVVGNVMSRGVDVVEAMLNRGMPYQSGPQWLAENVLHKRHVMAVAGTHGKTTTASMLAWILEDAGKAPGFLIGGIPANFGESARFGKSEYFVVEADEYDTAFFDKRAKFVHYRPRTVILNNLEYDHADIYKDMDAILWQFHQLLRTVPGRGRIIMNGADENIRQLVDQGCWTPVERFSTADDTDWTARFGDKVERHIGIAASAGISLAQAVDAMSRFEGVKRRMERTATVADIAIYDDFAHHPTAIARSIKSMRRRYPGHRVIVAIEPRSNTMKLGVHNDLLADSLKDADLVWMFRPDGMRDDFEASLQSLGSKLRLFDDYDRLVNDNGGFGSARQTLTALLQRTRSG